MNISRLFVLRPVATSLLMVALVLVGLVTILAFVIGSLIGVAAAWIAGHRNRRELSARRRRIEALERELMATQSQLEDHSVPAKVQLPATRQLQNVRQ